MEFGGIEREIHVEATPDVVYEVISTPEHLREWWPDEAELDPVPGATGVISFGDTKVMPLTVMEADPPRRLSFRWAYDRGEVATPANSLLVTFELIPSGSGTLLRFTETGFRERGWEAAALQERYRVHATRWDHLLPRLVGYLDRPVSRP
ncbi:SRPBCC domain-containing protein [Allorhizocola rhizosphaerae]|uniref:SRPBCC domain-containing protein n=1 Tax=Allorhizocola rhizosphaerae TaxID=1872709 RepID=UPI000E3B8D76|nr:SRPBCC domain-containing protein [Allorhizocola rhizosphaerae]